MKVTNSIVPKKEMTFSQAITGQSLQGLIKASVSDPKSVARFTGTLISTVASNENLQRCAPATVVASALKGEGMGLIVNQGYYLVPFGDTCQFVLGFKGLLQLAIATGDIADIDVVEVREGEMTGRSPKTKKPVFDFSVYETDEEANEHPIIGYMVYVEKKDGFYRNEYWTIAQLLEHGFRYSKAFKRDKYNKLVNGELSDAEVEKLKSSSPWYDIGGNQVTMFKKTCLRSILNSGYITLANSAALEAALREDSIGGGEGIIPDIPISKADVVVDGETGEIIDSVSESPKQSREKAKQNNSPNKTASKNTLNKNQQIGSDEFSVNEADDFFA